MELSELSFGMIDTVYRERIMKDFAPDEIKPLPRIREALRAGHYACYGAFEGESLAAYAFVATDGRSAMVDYFAVREDLRGRGTGSLVLRTLTDALARRFDCVLLESEDPDFAADEEDLRIRRNRIRFYLRNGLIDTAVRATVWHVRYRVLALPVGEIPKAERVRKIYAGIYRLLMPPKIFEKMVIIPD